MACKGSERGQILALQELVVNIPQNLQDRQPGLFSPEKTVAGLLMPGQCISPLNTEQICPSYSHVNPLKNEVKGHRDTEMALTEERRN